MRTNTSYFRVIAEVSTIDTTIFVKTFHFQYERNARILEFKTKIGSGSIVASFVVDKAHINGYERHIIYDNGIILIVNERSKRIITVIIARPSQIKRYWLNMGLSFPSRLQKVLVNAEINREKVGVMFR